jgi:phosphoesterase RecJ-like protein
MLLKSERVPADLLHFLDDGSEFIVVGHKEPDGDCVGSQLAMVSVLKRLGKEAIACSAGPIKRTEIKPFESRFIPCPQKTEGMRLLILDCSSFDRVGELPLEDSSTINPETLSGLPLAVIDHHATGDSSGGVLFLDTKAPSVTVMVLKVIEALGLSPSPEEAELLLFGLCTDTGFFRHLDETSEETFKAASTLAAAGASPKRIFAAINGGKTLNSRLLMGTVLAKTHSYYGGRLLLSSETLEESRFYGLESRDSDMIYQLLQSIEGVEAIVLIRQENPEECTIGFRSRDRIDVTIIARQFGGGGHKNAAGAKTASTIPELEAKLVEAFAPCFN